MSSCGSQTKKIEALTMHLDDGNVQVRRDAVVELSKIGTPSTIPALVKALEDESQYVRLVTADTMSLS